MQETYKINAVPRSEGGKGASRRLRREGLVPGIIYGGGKDPEMVSTAHNELFHHLENEAFYSHILTVDLNGATQSVVLRDLQRHPAKAIILHFDLMRVAQSDRIKMNVPLHFIGEAVAPGVKTGGGSFSHNLTDLEIICQAKDLPEYIEVDVSGMEVGDTMHLSELKLPEGVESTALAQGEEHDELLVTITAKRGEEEEEVKEEEIDEEGGEESEDET